MVIPSQAEKSRFCSRECKNKSQRTGEDVVCDNCGKIFHRRQFHIDRGSQHNFCCNECKGEYKHKNSIETRICEICGNSFECSKNSSQRFCSPECKNEWNKTLVGEKNPKYNRVETMCDYCGKIYSVKPSQFEKAEHHFCSMECRQKWYAEIHSQTDEYREMSRKRAAKILKDNQKNTDTKPQLMVNDILNNSNINYTNEKQFEYYAVDNYLDDYGLIIEVMGDYWHGNPIKYKTPNELNDMQIKRINLDKSKHTYIRNNYNIKILYLWESDIYKNTLLCEKLINRYIESNGNLNNFHSFNYKLINNELALSIDIIIPYQNKTISMKQKAS